MYERMVFDHEQEKREEVQDELRKQINELNQEIDECDCEIRKERSKKRGQNQSLISRCENYIANHQWHIDNLELVMRQIDNHIINPFGLGDLLVTISEYIQNYRNPDFTFDDSLYEEFDLTSTAEDGHDSENGDDGDDGDNGEDGDDDRVSVCFFSTD